MMEDVFFGPQVKKFLARFESAISMPSGRSVRSVVSAGLHDGCLFDCATPQIACESSTSCIAAIPGNGAWSATIRTELMACVRGLTHEVVISIDLTLDESGAITNA